MLYYELHSLELNMLTRSPCPNQPGTEYSNKDPLLLFVHTRRNISDDEPYPLLAKDWQPKLPR